MIDILTKIHDSFTLEFKLRFRTKQELKINHFMLNTWIFVPNSLDVNSAKYSRDDFYKDIRTNVRFITPVFSLKNIAGADAVPLKQLEAAMTTMAALPTQETIAEYEYQIKMFAAIFKSAIRDQISAVFAIQELTNFEQSLDELLVSTRETITEYRSLSKIIQTPELSTEVLNYFMFGNEFMSNLTEKELFGILKRLENVQEVHLVNRFTSIILEFLEADRKYKVEHHFPLIDPDSSSKNSEFIFRMGALKKYIESDLFLNAKKKRDGVLAEQVYYSLAAGLSMVFATGVAFSFQQKYGNFTMPFFVALVVSYMLKDRIKELMRFYFAHKHSKKYFDNKNTISIKDREIGWTKEGFDFVAEKNVPIEVLKVRNRIPLIQADNRYSKEKIILFRKLVKIDNELLDECSNYDIEGIVEIVRLNITSFIKKMDNPEVPLYALDENDSVKKIMGTKNYFLNIVFQYKSIENEHYKRCRVGVNRNGINSIAEM